MKIAYYSFNDIKGKSIDRINSFYSVDHDYVIVLSENVLDFSEKFIDEIERLIDLKNGKFDFLKQNDWFLMNLAQIKLDVRPFEEIRKLNIRSLEKFDSSLLVLK